jgi:Fe-S-cluster containining protein
MTPSLTDTLCTNCGLCCDGTLFADVELVGQAEVARLEIMGMDVEHEDRSTGLLSQPCAALRGTRCGIYAHRPKCCRVFECHLLQDAQRGAVTVERALEQIAGAREQIQQVRTMLRRLGNRDEGLPIKERCAETLAADGGRSTETIKGRSDLAVAMATLEDTIWNTFLGSGKRRPTPGEASPVPSAAGATGSNPANLSRRRPRSRS